jgi:hypothetical protein
LFVLHSYCQKIDVKPLKKAWEQLINNKELIGQINSHLERIERLVRARTSGETHKKETDEQPDESQSSESKPE